jgi:hypothetical protein
MRVVEDKMQEMHVPHFLTIQYMTDKPVTEMKKYSLKLANELMLYSNVSRNLIIWSSGTYLFALVPSDGRCQCDADGAPGNDGNLLADLNACNEYELPRMQVNAGAPRHLAALELILGSRRCR